MKLLLGSHGDAGRAIDGKVSGRQASSSDDDLPQRSPSKFQIAFVVNPVTGLMALGFRPFFESSWEVDSWSVIAAVAVGATGILIFELRLTELTGPLTVSVLAVIHNIVIVMYFLILGGERLSWPQLAGFSVSALGAFVYALSRYCSNEAQVAEGQSDEGEGSACEE
ncbi:unnamed protein product [Polarella glacialis]|uniref:Sugar phosphate transporter domain-containing protein n=1 Tax=Polarella glacialis TaxID=89957 RepID=A0A813F2T5_POLGL|nr:unnamed protein product [Polarella glacialis]